MVSFPLVLAYALTQAPTQPAPTSDSSLAAWQPSASPTASAEPVSSASTAPTPVASPHGTEPAAGGTTATPATYVGGATSTPPTGAPQVPPAPQGTAVTAPAAPPAAPAPDGQNPPDIPPVVRPVPGNWGMTFIFGGLGPLSVGGLGDQPLADGLMFTEIGVRRVFKRVVVPFSFGAGITHRTRPGTTQTETSAGVSASIAVLKGFRVWRRIAPYYGAFIHTHYVDAPGPDNWLVNLSVGPILGIEYFIADRVSLYGQGVLAVGPNFTKTSIQFVAQAVMAAGGQLGLTFYF